MFQNAPPYQAARIARRNGRTEAEAEPLHKVLSVSADARKAPGAAARHKELGR